MNQIIQMTANFRKVEKTSSDGLKYNRYLVPTDLKRGTRKRGQTVDLANSWLYLSIKST